MVRNRFQLIMCSAAVCAAMMVCSCKGTEVVEPVEVPEEVLYSSAPGEWQENVFSGEDQYGYFFTTPELGAYSMVEGEFKKSGGYEKSSFGFAFAYSADEEGWLDEYLRFEINTTGEYAVYAYKNGVYTDLVEANNENTAYLYPSEAVKGGYDSVNTLKIERTGDRSYTLYINGSQIAVATVPAGFVNGTGVMAFFSVGKADQEQFPDEPVRVTYRITDSTVFAPMANGTGEK